MKDRIWSDNNRDHVRSLHILGNMEWIYDRKNFDCLAEIILPSGLVFGNMSNSEFNKPIKPPGDRFSKPPISNPQITTFSVRNNAFNPESRRHSPLIGHPRSDILWTPYNEQSQKNLKGTFFFGSSIDNNFGIQEPSILTCAQFSNK